MLSINLNIISSFHKIQNNLKYFLILLNQVSYIFTANFKLSQVMDTNNNTI